MTKKTRDAILFLLGAGGVIHETVASQSERPMLLMLFAAMMGLPAFLAAERQGKGDKDDD